MSVAPETENAGVTLESVQTSADPPSYSPKASEPAKPKISANGLKKVPRDWRCDRCVKIFDLVDEDIDNLYKIYLKYDQAGTGWIPIQHYLDNILHLGKNILTDAIFELLNTKEASAINFGEFVHISCTFSCFEAIEMLKFMFYILDREKTGYVDKTEIKHLILLLWHHEVSSNLNTALEYFDALDLGDGRLTFKDAIKVYKRYPSTFHPIFQLQQEIQRSSLGEMFWENKKMDLKEGAELRKLAELAKAKKAAADAENAAALAELALVKQRLGLLKYYLMPWLREKERIKIKKIAAIQQRLEEEAAAGPKEEKKE